MEEETLLQAQPCVLGSSPRPRPLLALHPQGTEAAPPVAHREPRQGLGGVPVSPPTFKTALRILCLKKKPIYQKQRKENNSRKQTSPALCIPTILSVSESWQMILRIIYLFNQDFIKVCTEWSFAR